MDLRQTPAYRRWGRPLRLVLRRFRLVGTRGHLGLRGGRIRTRAGYWIHVDPRDPRALRLAAANGLLARQVAEVWLRLVKDLQPTLVIDVGANYGEIAFCTSYEAARVFLVEANPHVNRLLRKSLVDNQLDYVLLEGAATDAPGVLTLHVLDESSGLSSVERETAGGDTVDVEAFRLDARIGARSGEVAVIKIDVEGHELAVLSGLSQLLGQLTKYAIVLELNPEAASRTDELLARHDVLLLEEGTGTPCVADASRLAAHLKDWQTSPYRRDVVVTARGDGSSLLAN